MQSRPASAKRILLLLLTSISLAALVLSGFTLSAGDTQAAPQGAGIQAYCPGPDAFGYRCCTPLYCWVEISGTGTPVAGLADDNWVGPFDIGFGFPYYDVVTDTFVVESNGYLTLRPVGYGLWMNECPLPMGMTGTDYQIGILWDDLDFTVSGDVYYQTFANCPIEPAIQCLVVEFSNTAHHPDFPDPPVPGSAGTWEIILYENGDVLMQFQDAGVEEGLSSTTGLDGDRSDDPDWGIAYACNTAGSITDCLAVKFGFRADLLPCPDPLPCSNPCPTAVELASFEAIPAAGGVLLIWETISERDTVGFNLYRSTSLDALGEQLNETLILSASPGGGEGAAYEFLDVTALAGTAYYYTLEDVGASGVRTPHGPAVFTLWRAYLPLISR